MTRSRRTSAREGGSSEADPPAGAAVGCWTELPTQQDLFSEIPFQPEPLPRSLGGRGGRVDLMRLERAYWRRGYERIAGVDEAGMGPLAGPVVAAAVILPKGTRVKEARDSKTLTECAREALNAEIRSRAVCYAIGVATIDEIHRWNIYHAGLLAMRRAVDGLQQPPELVLIDARRLPALPWPQDARIRGDATIHCVACASILAKVHRDHLMLEYDALYPGYGFAGHKGYATAAHRKALAERGPCPIHRRTFRGNENQLELF